MSFNFLIESGRIDDIVNIIMNVMANIDKNDIKNILIDKKPDDMAYYIALTNLYYNDKYKKIHKLMKYPTIPFILSYHDHYMKHLEENIHHVKNKANTQVSYRRSKVFNITYHIIKPNIGKTVNMLDYSSGDCRKAIEFKQELKSHGISTNITCADIYDWGQYTYDALKNNKLIDNVYEINPNDQTLKNYTKSSYNIITIYHSLHHYPSQNIIKALKYLCDMINKDGIMILSEHDIADKPYRRYLVDIQHVLFDIVRPPHISDSKQKIPIIKYIKQIQTIQSRFVEIKPSKLVKYMKNVGMVLIKIIYEKNSVDFTYFGVFKKI